VVGLMNIQFAIQGDKIYVLEVNPRASRTIPFVSKVIGRPLAKIAARCMMGVSLAEQGALDERVPDYFSVKEAVFPFVKFPGVDPILGPEMKSTGEVMGVGGSFEQAFARAQQGAGLDLPLSGNVFISLRDADKGSAVELGRELESRGFRILATRGTLDALRQGGVKCEVVNKYNEGRPHIVDMIKNDQIALIINTVDSRQAIEDSCEIRRRALQHKVCYSTTLAGALATARALDHLTITTVNRLQDLHQNGTVA